MNETEQAWFYLPENANITSKQMAEWAAIAALSLRGISVDSALPIICLQEYKDESANLRLAELVMEFFIQGYWSKGISPDETAQLHIRLRMAATYLMEVDCASTFPRWVACLCVACLIGNAWKNGLLLWFAEKMADRSISGALPDVAGFENMPDDLLYQQLRRKYAKLQELLEKRTNATSVDPVHVERALLMPGYAYEVIKHAAGNAHSEPVDFLLQLLSEYLKKQN